MVDVSVLDTGAGGFVGAHVVDQLIAAGLGPIVAADIAPAPAATLADWGERVRFLALDVTDAAATRALVAETRPRHIVHAAALTPDTTEESAIPARIVAVNVAGAANIVEAAIAAGGVSRVVLFSSSSVYGGLDPAPALLVEDMRLPDTPLTLYGVTKFACEGLARRMVATGRLDVVAIRVTAVYGERERPTASRGANRVSLMHRLALAAVSGEPTPAGGADVGRDWAHGEDVGRAIVALLSTPKLAHVVYNVGAGQHVGWHRLLELFRAQGLDATGGQGPLVLGPGDARPPLSIARQTGDTGNAPRVSMVEGVARVVARLRREGAP